MAGSTTTTDGCSALTSTALRAARWPLSMVTVLNHVFQRGDIQTPLRTYSPENWPLVEQAMVVVDAFTRGFAIPAFFVISGYLFFNGVGCLTPGIYRAKMRRRVNTLLIPYLLWNMLAVAVSLALTLPWLAELFPGEADYYCSVKSFIWGFVGIKPGNYWPHDGSLWFIRDLMLAMLLMPVVYRLLRRWGAETVSVLGIGWFVSYTFFPGTYAEFISPALFFFYGGAWLSLRRVDLADACGRVFTASMIAFPVLGLAYLWLVGSHPLAALVIKNLNLLVGIVFCLNVAVWSVKRWNFNNLRFWAAVSFFIYASHVIVFYFYKPLIFRMLSPDSGMSVLLAYVAIFVSIGAILLCSYLLMRRYTPRALSVLTGSRRAGK